MTIFVTVGGQLPFDRLVSVVDAWASGLEPKSVFAQIGSSELQPSNIQWQPFLSRAQFAERMEQAQFVVSHAGMGTILTAIEAQKPILVMPRRAHLGEHRNDHQLGTVRRLPAELGVHVAANESELRSMLDNLRSLPGPKAGTSPERTRLVTYIRHFLADL